MRTSMCSAISLRVKLDVITVHFPSRASMIGSSLDTEKSLALSAPISSRATNQSAEKFVDQIRGLPLTREFLRDAQGVVGSRQAFDS
jgi:hypothetical protein